METEVMMKGTKWILLETIQIMRVRMKTTLKKNLWRTRIRNMRKHMLADHTDTGSVRKDHNCDTCHHIFNSKERLKGHKKKKYTT